MHLCGVYSSRGSHRRKVSSRMDAYLMEGHDTLSHVNCLVEKILSGFPQHRKYAPARKRFVRTWGMQTCQKESTPSRKAQSSPRSSFAIPEQPPPIRSHDNPRKNIPLAHGRVRHTAVAAAALEDKTYLFFAWRTEPLLTNIQHNPL